MALRFSMSLPLKIEAVGIKDLERLHTLAVTTFTETFASQNTTGDLTLYLKNKLSKKQLMKEILNPNSVFYLSYYQEINIEYLKLNFKSAQSENTHKKDRFEIERIYLLKAYQGKGLGSLLLEEALKKGREKGYKKVWLGVWEHNHKALAFYKKLGFRLFSKHKFLLGTDLQTDLLLELDF